MFYLNSICKCHNSPAWLIDFMFCCF
uniref:Uncharacterized protein n=1 Tax=Anguilla anguilla TaxID=7936 RepID=A0A0E9PE22_ANGAN